MATVSSHPHHSSQSNNANTASYSHRKPTKKSSILSLRREKKSTQLSEPTYPVITAPSMHTPLVSHDTINSQKPFISRPSELRGHSRRQSKSNGSPQDDSEARRARGKDRQHHRERSQPSEQSSYAFPDITDEEKPSRHRTAEDMKARSRSHSHTASSRIHKWDQSFHERTPDYPLRNSASTLSQFEDPPHTPIDDLAFQDPIFSLPVVVAAPVAGVETMDALVDGMDRYGHDDHFMRMTLSGRSKGLKSGYHPLYHPPLPQPPPGVKLGGALPRKSSVKSSGSDEEDDTRKASSSQRTRRQKTRRPEHPRSVSNITITKSSSSVRPSPSVEDYRSQSPSSATTKTVAPSISDIIRAHAPAAQQARSRKTSYSTNHTAYSNGHSIQELEPDIELVVTEDDTDLVSRSSVDTIAKEVRETIRAEKRVSSIPQSPGTHARPAYSPPSAPQMTRRSSYRSEGRRESSIYSSSTTFSDQCPLPPLDLTGLTKIPTSSPSQAIAQYLRSARLTTVLRLTRAPHGSRGNPLTVSLSDLGSPTGFPLVVFLGLGCVRHIMGLYDEMAQCLGIRLITIDR